MNTRTILVVEDDPDDENLTLRALRTVQTCCSVVVVRSGREALDYLFREGEFTGREGGNPDVVFLDNALPGLPGNELVRKIRDREDLKGMPLVVFSGSSDESLVALCLSEGANGFIEKPIDMKEYVSGLRAAAEHWLGRAG